MKKIQAVLLSFLILYLGSYIFLRSHYRIVGGSTYVQLPIAATAPGPSFRLGHYLHRLLEMIYLPATALDRRLTGHHTTFHSVIMDFDTSRPME